MTIKDAQQILSLNDRDIIIIAVGTIVQLSTRIDYLERQLKGIELELQLRSLNHPPTPTHIHTPPNET